MKTKYILLTAILLICSISIWGQTKKNTSANSTKAIAEKVQNLETNTQEQFSQLQNENKALKEQLQKMESEIALYREDVRTKVSEMNSNMSDWLAILAIIMSIVGIVIPIIINLWNNYLQKEKVDEITTKLNAASADAKASKKALTDVENLKEDITRIKQAIEESEKAAKKSADEAMANKLFTEAISMHEKDALSAIKLYSQAIEYNPNYSDAYNNRGNLKKELGDIDGAMADYNKAIELDPNSDLCLSNRGNLKADIKDYSGAIADYDRAIELNSQNYTAYNNRGTVNKQLGKEKEAWRRTC